jgi:hypothetical protein
MLNLPETQGHLFAALPTDGIAFFDIFGAMLQAKLIYQRPAD